MTEDYLVGRGVLRDFSRPEPSLALLQNALLVGDLTRHQAQRLALNSLEAFRLGRWTNRHSIRTPREPLHKGLAMHYYGLREQHRRIYLLMTIKVELILRA